MRVLERIAAVTTILTLIYPSASVAAERKKDLSRLQELADIKVTSVSKKPEDPFTAAAAVYVITREDIKRSGATSIDEVLRLVPGMDVAVAGANWKAVSARGFNDNIANKLLVLIDGRTVYNTLFSGVWWDEQNILMEDIKQIEVIRGPGAALWGSNAVNGIINIITEDAVNTLDKLVTITAGNEMKSAATRVGGSLSDNAHYRVYAKFTDIDDLRAIGGGSAKDGWDTGLFGFRVDWDKSSQDSITIQGNGYNNNINRTATLPILTAPFEQEINDDSNVLGGNVLSRWTHNLSEGGSTTLQSYIDHTERNFSVSREHRSIFDLDFQHALAPIGRNEFTWGAGYRFVKDEELFRPYFAYQPERREDHLWSSFLQNKITLVPEKLYFTLGSKFEYNEYTDFEVQPNARASWLITPDNTVWASVSKAVRTPSRGEQDVQQIVGVVPISTPGYVSLLGNKNQDSEKVVSYEMGYRTRPLNKVTLDVTTFYNDYKDLKTLEAEAPFSTASTLVPLRAANNGNAYSYGVEVAAEYAVTDWWKLSGAYSFINLDTGLEPNSRDTSLVAEETKAPTYQFNIRSHMTLLENIEFDNMLYYVDDLEVLNIPEYYRFDSRIAWKPLNGIELSLVGQNLLDDHHQEFTAIPILPSVEIGRTVYGKISWRF
ncbi:MAG: ligand-gated TonB-dependent outer rane channel [Rickettsiales bacterium]|jgi:iron complex outermembrane receptor protein|nr:ligand-gated TonB-dependent outer rane channel [Rickettsiales bacterium]